MVVSSIRAMSNVPADRLSQICDDLASEVGRENISVVPQPNSMFTVQYLVGKPEPSSSLESPVANNGSRSASSFRAR